MGRQRVVKVIICDKCLTIFADEDITICYNADSDEILGCLCDSCLQEWFEYEQVAEDERQ